MRQPSDSRAFHSACVSTPSATTPRPRSPASRIVDRTMVSLFDDACMLATNERSILMELTGSRLRCAIEENPVP